METQQSFTVHEADFMSKSTTITKLQALFRSGGVKQLSFFEFKSIAFYTSFAIKVFDKYAKITNYFSPRK